ncbi:tRNA lysidine(34) synthetase TilS [Candidatus Colwellia aromaticivorans]|uniref:tRNA lysidine(34) synthetase TilS n=1 Tax=Candidatus Colwellia aromaticivorans TaxID=2267621 RepID=UPI000DF1F1D9|nr:tRNA lysidine(34) synthetase TilS [Candidatus Colwellia aromaticivorans]
MTIIESALVSAINKHPKTPLVIAYSGGVDSQVLLHALAKLKHAKKFPNILTVCHVNHGLSENATTWQNFAEQACQKLNLPFVACQVNVQPQAQHSLEALAREARYQALQSLYDEQTLIITGHHRDDQAETFLLALKRGAGLKGLSAMAAEARQGKDIFMRPLLKVSRAEIVHYAKEQQLDWVEDESNSDTRFDRNFIRQTIMPLLSERWPSIVQTINRSSSHCLEGQLLLNEMAEQDLANCQLSEQCLSVIELSKFSAARFNNLVRYFLAQHNYLMPSTEQLAQVYQQLLANEDKNPAVKVANNYLRRYKDALYLTADFIGVTDWQKTIYLSDKQTVAMANEIELPDGLGKLTFSNNQFVEVSNSCQQIALPTKEQKVTLRFCHDNPTCLPDYRNHSRSLKKVLQELNIPPWQRKRIPFLYYNDLLVAAIGHFVCQTFSPNENESSITVTWTT